MNRISYAHFVLLLARPDSDAPAAEQLKWTRDSAKALRQAADLYEETDEHELDPVERAKAAADARARAACLDLVADSLGGEGAS